MRLSYRLLLLGLAATLVMLTGSAPAMAQTVTTTPLIAVADARTQRGSPDVNFGAGYLYVATAEGHHSFVRFDLSVLPASAVVEAARLELNAQTENDGPNNVEVGRVDEPWDDDTLTWGDDTAITWGGPITPVSGITVATWDVTRLVRDWQAGTVPNYGFALRGDGGEPLSFDSLENGIPPRLEVRYRTPPVEGPRPDLGDAPDSSNSLGIPNSAYPGVNGEFPTVFNVPAGQPAGPRHANARVEAVLGEHLSREGEADGGPDEDTLNNILAGGADNADNDRGDDGWRNRNAAFVHCQPTTLTVRVRKANAASLSRMYLNVWFDGNRDGDWADQQPCTPEESPLAIPASEWIVQDYSVDLSGIAPGGYVDIDIITEAVLNTTPRRPHWMRFTLSDERAAQSPAGRADGRGPAQGFAFGETEDVLHEPQPPGQPGEVVLEQRTPDVGGQIGEYVPVAYEILLRHIGGSEPVALQLRNRLPDWSIIYMSGNVERPVRVQSPTGGARPLRADIRFESFPSNTHRIDWDGTLDPDSEIVFRFNAFLFTNCAEGQLLRTIANVVEVKGAAGPTLSDTVEVQVRCPNYERGDVAIDWDGAIVGEIDLIDPGRPLPLRPTITNNHAISVTLGLVPTLVRPGAPSAISAPSFEAITLAPGESRELELTLRTEATAGDELGGPADDNLEARLDFCFLPGPQADSCPDRAQYPNLWGAAEPLRVTPRPNDLGDAPDGSNQAGQPMTAYPNVPANFPTVFDASAGQPQGPRHSGPRPLNLGARVSLEAEADAGPDQDPSNNIDPAANSADLDRGDDGARLTPPADNCRPTTAEVRVSVSSAAAQWFQSQGQPAYLNAWLDSNRDGDWADGFACPTPGGPADVVEHIVIDYPVDVAALGPGLHTLSVPTAGVAWPAQLAEQPAWVRFTLSERPAAKPLQFGAISYGDGRGDGAPFLTGETEDYLWRAASGADLAVELVGRSVEDRATFKIDYTNHGTTMATGATLIFRKPTQLHGTPAARITAPGIPPAGIDEGSEEVRFSLPALQPGDSGTIVLVWAEPIRVLAVPALATADLEAGVRIMLAGDTNLDNNEAAVTVQRVVATPIVAARVAGDKGWGVAEVTCRTTVDLVGLGTPGEPVQILLDGTPVAEATPNGAGLFETRLQNLSAGLHRIGARPADPASTAERGRLLRLAVDPTLPIDPLTLVFTDSQGRSFHPSLLTSLLSGTPPLDPNIFKPGETYTAAIASCGDDPDLRLFLDVGDGEMVQLLDEDGDGTYSATFTKELADPRSARLAQADDARLIVMAKGVRQAFPLNLGDGPSSVVRDGTSNTALANAHVLLLSDRPAGDGVTFTPWPEAALGRPNPQASDPDGGYSLGGLGELSRVLVEQPGYQPYRSRPFAPNGSADIPLTPVVNGPADYVVSVGETGFVPAVLRVPRGSRVAWVNTGLGEHSVVGTAGDSGALMSGEGYGLQFANAGSYTFRDPSNPGATMTVLVEESGRLKVFLPLVGR